MISTFSQTPQLFSRDMYVRLRASEIAKVKLHHLYSEVIGSSGAKRPAGMTEWEGVHGHNTLSVAWDWIHLSDGVFRLPTDSVVRTNVMLVDGSGYDTDPAATAHAWMATIAGLHWQGNVQRLLNGRGVA